MKTKLRALLALERRVLTPLPQSHNRTKSDDTTLPKITSLKKLKPLKTPADWTACSLDRQDDSPDSEEFDAAWNRCAERSKFLLTADGIPRRHSERPNLTSFSQKRLAGRELPKHAQKRRESCPVEVHIAFSPSQSAMIAHRNRLEAVGTETKEEHDSEKAENPSRELWKKNLKAKLRTKKSVGFLPYDTPKLRTHTKKTKPSYSLQLSRALQPVDVHKFFCGV